MLSYDYVNEPNVFIHIFKLWCIYEFQLFYTNTIVNWDIEKQIASIPSSMYELKFFMLTNIKSNQITNAAIELDRMF